MAADYGHRPCILSGADESGPSFLANKVFEELMMKIEKPSGCSKDPTDYFTLDLQCHKSLKLECTFQLKIVCIRNTH